VSSSTTVIGMKLGVSDYLVVNDFGAVAHEWLRSTERLTPTFAGLTSRCRRAAW
jgi:hypothetical protein